MSLYLDVTMFHKLFNAVSIMLYNSLTNSPHSLTWRHVFQSLAVCFYN